MVGAISLIYYWTVGAELFSAFLKIFLDIVGPLLTGAIDLLLTDSLKLFQAFSKIKLDIVALLLYDRRGHGF